MIAGMKPFTGTPGSWLLVAISLTIVAWGPQRSAWAESVEAEVCSPKCDDKECGFDGCNGECGQCAANSICLEDVCQFNGGCEPSALPGCGGCTCQACTCQLDPYCCTGKWDPLCVARCETDCGGCGKQTICGDGVCHKGESCSDCPVDCGPCPPACGQITAKGCCTADTLISCQNGVLEVVDCSAPQGDAAGTECGWSPEEERYACGGSGDDPTGSYPAACQPSQPEDIVEDVPTPQQCQGVGYAGCCLGSLLYWCDGTGLHSLDCGANPAPFDECGWSSDKGYYDCGGIGADPTGDYGQYCPNIKPDVKTDTGEEPVCKVGELVALDCQEIPFEGCCSDGGAHFFCEDSKLLCVLDCSKLTAPSDTCGWYSGLTGYYDCGGNGPDPSGDFPLACPPLLTDTDIVSSELTIPQAGCTGIPPTGCCGGSTLSWCEEGHLHEFNCETLAGDPVFGDYNYCGVNPGTGEVDCLKKPDPSPPLCNTEIPDHGPDLVEAVDVDGTPDLPDQILELLGELVGDSGAGETLSDQSPADGVGLIIPAEASPESGEDTGSGDGCAMAGPASSRCHVWSPVLLALGLLLCCGIIRARDRLLR